MPRKLVFELNIDSVWFHPDESKDTRDHVRDALDELMGGPYDSIASAIDTVAETVRGRIFIAYPPKII